MLSDVIVIFFIFVTVNDGKIKYMLSTSRDLQHIDSLISADNYAFDTVKEFVYVGCVFTTINDVRLEIKRRITLLLWAQWAIE